MKQYTSYSIYIENTKKYEILWEKEIIQKMTFLELFSEGIESPQLRNKTD